MHASLFFGTGCLRFLKRRESVRFTTEIYRPRTPHQNAVGKHSIGMAGVGTSCAKKFSACGVSLKRLGPTAGFDSKGTLEYQIHDCDVDSSGTSWRTISSDAKLSECPLIRHCFADSLSAKRKHLRCRICFWNAALANSTGSNSAWPIV